MSRFKKIAHSLASGYVLVGMNVLYTLASVPLALHYLAKVEFGLWVLIVQASGYLLLLDLGMSASISRILIDHKDDARSTAYGSTIQTGCLVLLVQGVIIALGGGVISSWLPELMKVQAEYAAVFRSLMIWQCIALGASSVGRILPFILQAHQRYDVHNHAQTGGFVANMLALWAGFELQMGLYSLLLGSVANLLFMNCYCLYAVVRLKLLPTAGLWGRADWVTFRGLFLYATDIFLLAAANMLIFASQVIVVSRTLGVEAAAVWSLATKVFVMAQQLVYRIFDFSSGALAEMMVRGERERLKMRFRDVVIVTGSIAAVTGMTLALCNAGFLTIWTHGRIAWSPLNDLLMAVSFFVYSTTRLSIGLIGITKRIGAIKFVYFVEGAVFVGLAFLLAPHLGFGGVIGSGILTNFLFSGIYGSHRTVRHFSIPYSELLRDWFSRPVMLLVVSGIVAFAIWLVTRSLNAPLQFTLNGSLFGIASLFLLWFVGLPKHLRSEARDRLQRFWRSRFCGSIKKSA